MDKGDVVHIYNGILVIKRNGIGPFAETRGRNSYCSWIPFAIGAHSHNLLLREGSLRSMETKRLSSQAACLVPPGRCPGHRASVCGSGSCPLVADFQSESVSLTLVYTTLLAWCYSQNSYLIWGGMNSFGLPSKPWWEIRHQGLGSLSLLGGVLGGVRFYHSVFPFSFGITNQFVLLFPPSRVLLLSLALFPGFIAAAGEEKLGEINLHPLVQIGSVQLFLNVHDSPTKLWGLRHRDHVLMLCLQCLIQLLTLSMHFLSKY